MTISTTNNRAQWQGNGATTVFSFNFEIGNVSEIVLQLTNSSGTITLIPSSSFSVAGLGNPAGGTITYPLGGSPLASGNTLTLTRIVPLQQLTDLENQSNYFPDAVEGALDYLMMALQQVSQVASYALQAPQSDASPGVVLPAAVSRAGMILGFDSNGNVTTISLPASVGAGNLSAELGGNGRPGFKNGTDFTAGTTSSLTLSKAYGTVSNVFVAFDGIYQERDSYIINGNQITFGAWISNAFTPQPIPVGVTNVDVVGGTTLSIYVPPNGSVGSAQIVPNSVGDAQLAWGAIMNRVVDSIAALGALSVAVYTRCFVTGYYGVGDGGGGPYYYSATTPQASANGGSIIAAAGGVGCWILNTPPDWYVEQFGAKGDGVTDDSGAFNAALAALPSHGGIVRTQGKTYAIAHTINLGNGNGASVSTINALKLIGRGCGFAESGALVPTVLNWTGANTTGTMISVNGQVSNCRIEGFYLGCNGLCSGISLTDFSGSVVEDIKIANPSSIGLAVIAGTGATGNYNILNRFARIFCSLSTNGTTGLYMDGYYANSNDTWMSMFELCRFEIEPGVTNSQCAWFKFVDSDTFVRCHFDSHLGGSGCSSAIFDGTNNANFPAGMAFYDCSLNGTIGVAGTIRKNYFYGFGTYDNEPLPSNANLIGITDQGVSFGGFVEPLSTLSSGPGQFTSSTFNTTQNSVLPAGGTWEWTNISFNLGASIFNVTTGISAGGSVIDSSANNKSLIAKRIS